MSEPLDEATAQQFVLSSCPCVPPRSPTRSSRASLADFRPRRAGHSKTVQGLSEGSRIVSGMVSPSRGRQYVAADYLSQSWAPSAEDESLTKHRMDARELMYQFNVRCQEPAYFGRVSLT